MQQAKVAKYLVEIIQPCCLILRYRTTEKNFFEVRDVEKKNPYKKHRRYFANALKAKVTVAENDRLNGEYYSPPVRYLPSLGKATIFQLSRTTANFHLSSKSIAVLHFLFQIATVDCGQEHY